MTEDLGRFLEELATHFPSEDGAPTVAPLRSGGGSAGVSPILESRTHTNSTHPPVLYSHHVPEHGPHWHVRITDYGDDLQELIAVYRSEPLRRATHNGEKRTGSRDQMRQQDAERSAKRAKRRIRESVLMLRADTMMTLTTRENLTDLDIAWLNWRKFSTWLARRYPWAQNYVIVHETQKRGALHFHVALKTEQNWIPYGVLIKKWRQIIGGDGSVNFRRNTQCRERQRPAAIYSYLAKYLGKDMHTGEMNRKRYEVSRGCPTPVSITVYLSIGDATHFQLARILRDMSGRLPVTTFTPPGLIYLRTF